MYFVYILRSLRDGNLYVGMTVNLSRRIEEHNLGLVRSTRYRKPLMLIHSEQFVIRTEAFMRERELKLPSAGKFKKKLISQ